MTTDTQIELLFLILNVMWVLACIFECKSLDQINWPQTKLNDFRAFQDTAEYQKFFTSYSATSAEFRELNYSLVNYLIHYPEYLIAFSFTMLQLSIRLSRWWVLLTPPPISSSWLISTLQIFSSDRDHIFETSLRI